MNSFKRAITCLRRQPGKSAILLGLVFVLGTTLSGAIAVRNAILAVEEQAMMQIPALATIDFNWQNAAQEAGVEMWDLDPFTIRASQPTRTDVATIGSLPYVRVYDFAFNPRFFSHSLSWAEMSIDIDRLPTGLSLRDAEGAVQGVTGWGGTLEHFTGRGVANPNITDIDANLITLHAGRTFTQAEIDNNENVVLVSRLFADVNGLSIGSTIELENIAINYALMGTEGSGNFMVDRANVDFWLKHQIFEVEVIGIFEMTHEFIYENYDAWRMHTALHNRGQLYNRIYMPIGVAQQMIDFVNNGIIEIADDLRAVFGAGDAQGLIEEAPRLESMFILSDPRNAEAFASAANEMLPANWEILDLRATTSYVIASMDTLLQLADFIQWMTIGASVIVLTLILVILFRERRREIGIYMALGDKRGRIIGQMLLEVWVVAVVGITLALFTSSLLSDNISRSLLEQQLSAQITQGRNDGTTAVPWQLALFNPAQLDAGEMLAMHEVSLDLETVVIFVSASSMVVLVSTVLPILYLVKLNPKKVLL